MALLPMLPSPSFLHHHQNPSSPFLHHHHHHHHRHCHCHRLPCLPSASNCHRQFGDTFSVKWSFHIHACSSDSGSELRQEEDRKNEDNPSQKESSVPWGFEDTVATMVTYYGVLHIPLSISGLSLVSATLHMEMIEPQTKAIFLVLLQLTELIAAVSLIESTVQPFHIPPVWLAFNIHDFLQKRRNILSTLGGLGGLFLIMASVSTFTYTFLHGETGESKQYLRDILSGSSISTGCTFLTYCLITPFLEEYMYRGFLLTSLAAYMPRPSAIVLSAVLFSMAHFSVPDLIYFFIIGCILGVTSNITGNLIPSFVIHSCYNFVVLMSVLLQR